MRIVSAACACACGRQAVSALGASANARGHAPSAWDAQPLDSASRPFSIQPMNVEWLA